MPPPSSRGLGRKYHQPLRISSLDPNTPRAEKGEHQSSRMHDIIGALMNDKISQIVTFAGLWSLSTSASAAIEALNSRRRIRCDRSLPTCKKCGLRETECPGYGLRLRWIPRKLGPGDEGGVQKQSSSESISKDVAHETLRPSQDIVASHHSGSPSHHVEFVTIESSVPQSDKLSSSSEDSNSSQDSSSSSSTELVRQTEQPVESSHDQRYGIDLTLLLKPLPDYLQDSSVRRLLHHYDHSVAATMVWIDSPDNPWRNIMLPLAVESPPLLLSMLALSAEHLSARMRSNKSSDLTLIPSRKYRDNSLGLLARQLRDEVRAGGKASLARRGPAQSTIATMLMQCTLEMVQPSSDLWRLHLKAARTMIQRWASMSHVPDNSDSTSRFLLKEVFMIDAFASTTVFGEEDELLGIAPIGEDNSIFTEYLRVIRDVTATERQRYNSSILGIPSVEVDIQELRKKFEYTRARTLRLSRELHFGSEMMRRDFSRIVEIFHHAGLIYSYQALVESQDVAPETLYSLQCLFDTLRLFSDSPAFAQDIVWPLFIAGTQSRGRIEEQVWIEKRLVDAMQSTGFSNCQQALEFLQSFWTTDPRVVSTWIKYAREYASRGQTFLVF